MGRMEDFTEGKVMSMMTLNGTGAIEATGNTGRTDDAIAYVSPTVNGLHVGVAGYAVTADSDAIDATDMAIFYDNGPLSVKIAQEKNDNAAESLAIGASYAMGDVKVSALHVNRKDDSDSTVDHNDVMLRLDYTMGSNKFTIASLDDEQTTGIDGTDVTAVELTHSFSSRTSAYIGATDSKAADADTTYVGMIHKF
jgi:predicted porin